MIQKLNFKSFSFINKYRYKHIRIRFNKFFKLFNNRIYIILL